MDNSSKNKLYYRVIGNGHPVVFLHGFMLSSDLWEGLVTSVPEGYQIILIDLPGHGQSSNIHCPDTLSAMAHTVQNTIHSVVSGEFSIVGHSLGGYIALELLATGCNIQKCVLLNSNFWEDSAEKKKERNRICKVVQLNAQYLIQEAIPHLFPPIHKEKHETRIQKLITVALQMHPDNISNATIAMRDRQDLSKVIVDNQSKFFIVQGLLDHIIPVDLMDYYLEKNNLKQTLIQKNNSGHMSIVENQKEVSSMIFEFLA